MSKKTYFIHSAAFAFAASASAQGPISQIASSPLQSATTTVLSPTGSAAATTDVTSPSDPGLSNPELEVLLAAEADAVNFMAGSAKRTAVLNRAMTIAKRYSAPFSKEMKFSEKSGPTDAQLAEIVIDLANGK